MNQNSIIEIGSKANVILRFIIETTLNGITYAAKEPYLFLKDVRVVINYSNQDKTGRTDKTVVANSDVKPRSVSIGDIVFSRKIAGLLSTLVNEEQPQYKSKFETGTASEGVIYLAEETKHVNPDPTLFFVYDEFLDKVEDVTYNAILNTVESSNFVNDSVYLISFSSVISGTKFDLLKTHIPYMSIEIQGEGNIDKEPKNVVMFFEKVSLESLIDFTFIQNTMINVPLSFHIIGDTGNYVVYEDGVIV